MQDTGIEAVERECGQLEVGQEVGIQFAEGPQRFRSSLSKYSDTHRRVFKTKFDRQTGVLTVRRVS